MKDERKLFSYFQKYSRSLQNVVFERTGNYFHDNLKQPIQFVYMCPLCVKNKIAALNGYLHLDEEFNEDHFPPNSVGGKRKVMVCQKCNAVAGSEFDYTLKEWLRDKSATQWIKGTKIPVRLALENVKGNYKGSLIVKDAFSFEYDFKNYPLLKARFDELAKGGTLIQTIRFDNPDINLVYKALLKSAYLYCFSIWGYDFVYSHTGKCIREVLINDQKHILSNSGIFFHMTSPFPPIGLCYIFKPVELQAFMVNFKLVDQETKFECYASVLIPGADDGSWQKLIPYQKIIDKLETFTNAFIQLPDNLVSSKNFFPYTTIWKQRSTFRILGETNGS